MALSFVGFNAAVANSVALPSFQVGDIALVFAYRDGSNTPPDAPASGWTGIASSGAHTNSSRVGYRVLQAGDTTTGTWFNATELEVIVLRGQAASPIAGSQGSGTNASSQIEYEYFALPAETGSWFVGLSGHRTATNVKDGAVTDWTNRSSGGVVGSLSCHTATDLTPAANSFTVNASSAWRSYTIEVRAASAPTSTTTGTARISLAAGDVPASRAEHEITLRARKTSSSHIGAVIAQLYEGTTARTSELSTGELTTSLASYVLPVSDAEAAAIGSYANLELRLRGVSTAADATVFEIAEASLAVPAAGAGESFGAAVLSSTVTVSAAGVVVGAGSKNTGTARISLEAGSTPQTRAEHDLVIRARKTNAAHTGEIEAQLYEGTTPRSSVLSTGNLTDSLADYTLSIADADAATIGSYADLEVRLRGVASTGDAAVFEIAELELLLPGTGTGGATEGAAVLSSIVFLSVGSEVPIYPATDIYPHALATVQSTGTITASWGTGDAFGAAVLASTVTIQVAGASPPGDHTGLVLLASTATITAAGDLPAADRTGEVVLDSTATITVGAASVQDVVGAAVLSGTATIIAAGFVPSAPLPADFIDLPDLPDLLIAIAFDSAPLDAVQDFTGVASFARGFGSKRGRQFELDRVEAGALDFLLSNLDGRFNPENTSSPYYPNLKATRRARVAMRWPTDSSGVLYEIFQGFLEGYPQEYPDLGNDRIVRQRAVDAFMALRLARLIPGSTTLVSTITTAPAAGTSEVISVASTLLPMPQVAPFEIALDDETMTVTEVVNASSYRVERGTDAVFHSPGAVVTTKAVSFGQEMSGTRIANLLQAAGWTGGADLDSGNSLLAATGDIVGDDPLTHIQAAAEAENGRFFVSKDGFPTFRERHWFFKNELASRGTFGDEAGELPYHDAKVTHEDEKIWNVVRITPASGNTQEARDEASIADHFERVLEKSWPLADDNEALAAAQYLVQRYSRMQVRIPELKLKGRADPDALWPHILGLEQGQRYRFIRRPTATETAIDKELVVESVAHSVSPDDMLTTVEMSLADPQTYWRLEVAGYTELDSTTALAY